MVNILDTPKLVEQNFNAKGAQQFWHYTLKRCRNDLDYSSSQLIEQRINQIVAKIGENSFQRQENYGWTPLHIAAITGNAAGIRFLFRQNVEREIQDEWGRRPVDYLENLHPELLDAFSFPHHFSSRIGPAIDTVLARWTVQLPPLRGYRANTDDFGKVIKSIFVSKPIENDQHCNRAIHRDLSIVFQILGINYTVSPCLHYVRDQWVRIHTGEVLRPFISDYNQQNKAADRVETFSVYFDKNSMTHTHNPYYKGLTGKTFLHCLGAGDTSLAGLGTQAETAHFSFEGGNVFTLTNPRGRVKVLIGRDHRLMTLNMLRLNGTMTKVTEDPTFGGSLKRLKEQLSPEKIKKVAEYLFAQGLLKQDGQVTTLSFEQIRDVFEEYHTVNPRPFAFREIAIKKRLIKPFKWQVENVETCRDMVARYQMQKYVSHKMTASSLKLDPFDVHYVSQAGYHLDTFLKPGPHHSVFVQDFELCLEILQAIRASSDSLNLTDIDRALLERYICTAEKLGRELNKLMTKVKEELTKADLTIIPMPANFMYEPEGYYESLEFNKATYNVNFINALSGWSPERERYFFITTGAKAGDRLGDILMDTFHRFLENYVPGIEVFFVGRTANTSNDFSEPMKWWNRPDGQSGVHCFTFERETADHM